MPLLLTLFALAAWKNYTLGGLNLELPDEPSRVAEELGHKVWLVRAGDEGETVMIQAGPMGPFDLPEVTLASAAQGAAAGPKDRLVEQKDLLLNGWPGIGGLVDTEGVLQTRFRVFRVKDQIFSVFSTMDEASSERIFKSIVPAARFGKGSQKQAGPRWIRATLRGFSIALPDEPSVEPDLLTGSYGNRTYTIRVSKAEPTAANEAARKENAAIALERAPAILNDTASERLEAKSSDGKMTFLAESVVLNGKTVTLTAFVPRVLRDSEEVKRFFGSLKRN